MKKIFLFILLLPVVKTACCQIDTSALYFKYPDVPPFTITRVPDSTKFAKANLQTGKPLIIMVFSPDCEHCTHEVKEILAHIDFFKKTQILMIAHLDFHYLKKFYSDYKIAAYPNIILGRDYSYFFGTFFNIKALPAIYVYNKKGKLKAAFDGSVPVQRIAAAL